MREESALHLTLLSTRLPADWGGFGEDFQTGFCSLPSHDGGR
jgi:hypothetical protein